MAARVLGFIGESEPKETPGRDPAQLCLAIEAWNRHQEAWRAYQNSRKGSSISESGSQTTPQPAKGIMSENRPERTNDPNQGVIDWFPHVYSASPNRMVGIYLMACYLYYYEDYSPITDIEFDYVCRRLKEEFNNLTHPHAKLLDWGALDAGTGYHFKLDDYPKLIVQAALHWRTQQLNQKGKK